LIIIIPLSALRFHTDSNVKTAIVRQFDVKPKALEAVRLTIIVITLKIANLIKVDFGRVKTESIFTLKNLHFLFRTIEKINKLITL